MATSSICLYKISLKMKYDYLVAKDNNFLNSDLFKPSTLSFRSYIDFLQILLVSSSGMLVKSESTSKNPYKSYCSTISFAKEKESLTVDSLICNSV